MGERGAYGETSAHHVTLGLTLGITKGQEVSSLDWEESTSPQFQPMGTHKQLVEENN